MANFRYHPGTVVRLGGIYDQAEPEKDKNVNGYIVWRDRTDRRAPSISEARIQLKEIRTVRESYEELGYNFSAEARVAFTTGKGSYSQLARRSWDERTIAIALYGTKQFAAQTTDGHLELSQPARERVMAIRERNDMATALSFRRVVGSDVITEISHGVSVAYVYYFRASRKEILNEIKAAFEAQFKAAGTQAAGDLQKIIHTIDSTVEISTELFMTGGRAPEEVGKGNDYPEVSDLGQTKKWLLDFLSNARSEDAVPLTFTTSSIADLPDIAFDIRDKFVSADQLLQHRLRSNNRRFELYLECDARLKQVEDLLYRTPPAHLKNEKLPELKETARQLRGLEKHLADDFFKSELEVSESTTRAPDYEFPAFMPTDYVRRPFVDCVMWHASGVAYDRAGPGCEGNDCSNLSQNFSPVLNLHVPGLIEQMRLFQNGIAVHVFGKAEVQGIARNEGRCHWKRTHTSYNVNTGPNLERLPQAQMASASAFSAHEKAVEYLLEVMDVAGATQRVDIGSYGRTIPNKLLT